ncbi:MAG: IS701 family transposase [Gammaproteobacteria bacterium]
MESRFQQFCGRITAALAHVDRVVPASLYLRGLIMPGDRKSVEPMAARVMPQAVQATHHSMHHLVAQSPWSDTAVLAVVAEELVPALTKDAAAPVFWILDDTGVPKKGDESVGVARQYCGQLGKQENCRTAVSLTFATPGGSIPLQYQLYLPKEWTDEPMRCRQAGVPEEIGFATKNQIARQQIAAALAAGTPRGIILSDAAYGDEADFRDYLTAEKLLYAVGIRPNTGVWWGAHQPAPMLPAAARGRARTRLVRNAAHQPMAVHALAQALPKEKYRTVTWRDGTAAPLSSRFARVRVTTAHENRQREEEWLVIEWPENEAQPTRYFLSTLAHDISFKSLVGTIKGRWRIERDYLELKQEVGLGHYEGRNWRGFHHHATLCIAAYAFLMLERLRGVDKTSIDMKELKYPKYSTSAPFAPMYRHVPWSIATIRFRLAGMIAHTLGLDLLGGRGARRTG